MRITIVSDNNGQNAGSPGPGQELETSWGFSCVVEVSGHRILFDTGSDGPMLVRNMRAVGVEPESIDMLVLSHEHWDHVGGIDELLASGARPTVYVPGSFSAGLRERLARDVPVVEVTGRTAVGSFASTTGEMGTEIIEQGLAVETGDGVAVVTGCAHPGIVEMVRVAADGRPIALVVGGFHLKDADERAIDQTISALDALGVRRVAPTHCTGELARVRFAAAFGDRYSGVGVGSILELGG
ncbi:MAG: MBL fold metallo-hydrolase [Coriobacteriia bacterium]|nr:MBL fold metallo-hydrolase [Coriobacteriia bacterium]MBN2839981.1 MBL fold metallo-hydrolase [Coriobacteriia bacterium]